MPRFPPQNQVIMIRPLRAIFLGPPGAGKGTLTGRLCRDFPPLITISSGDVLRQHISDRTAIGVQAESCMRQGKLVPDKVMIDLITSEMKSRGLLSPSASWILDGFPRTEVQAPALEKALAVAHANINLVVVLDVPESVILDRIENRWIHEPSGRVYNLTFNPPKVPGRDDVTGEPLVKRLDDNVETFQKRLASYRETTLGLIDYFNTSGLVQRFSGTSSDEIYPKLLSYVKHEYGTQHQPLADA